MTDINPQTAQMLLSYIERAERLDQQERDIKDDKKELFAEAKGNGFDPKILRKVVARRAVDADKQAKLDEEELLIETYMQAINSVERSVPRTSLAQARDAREGQARPQVMKLETKLDGGAFTSPTAQGNGVAGSRPEEADDDGVMAFPARRSSNGTQSPEVATQHEGRANSESAVTAFPAANYTPTPVPAAAPIDLTIPEFLRRTPAQIGGAA